MWFPVAVPAVMSSNGETNVVLRGVTHGAVDFLIKPVRVEELRNVWQHVVRRKRDQVNEVSQLAPFLSARSTDPMRLLFACQHFACQLGVLSPARS